ncbi:uncharacterized protein [Littorina saxatilis]|uniref:uncharacterized protein n=1 Tax=Littorina saxatilis TaxID=31220 RepID=UPI0038B58B05
MTPLLVLGLLAATAVAAPNTYSGPSGPLAYGGGAGYGPPHGGGYAKFSPRELLNLEEYIAGVNGERVDLNARLFALKNNEGALINRLDDVLGKLDGLDTDQETQDGRVRQIADRIRQNLISIGNLEGDLAGEVEISRRLVEAINTISERQNELINANTVQDGLLARAETVLDEAKEKLEEKITAKTDSAVNDVQELSDNTDAAVTVVNSKQCYVGEVGMEIGADGSGKAKLDIPYGTFSGEDIPTVFTGIQGFDSDINLGKSKPPRGNRRSRWVYKGTGLTVEAIVAIERQSDNAPDQPRTMTPLLVLGLLAATAVAAPNTYSGPSGPLAYGGGAGYGPPHGGGYAKFSPRELLNLEEYIAGVNGERVDLNARLFALKNNEGALINRLDDVLGKLDGLDTDQETQDGRVRQIADRIRQNLISIGNL